MRLIKARVQHYRSVEDSGEISIEDDVTCLVGKNESGKTAVLQALHLLNPLNPIKGKKSYDEVMDYPSRHYAEYKRNKDKIGAAVVLTATFCLDDREVEAIARDFGNNFLKSREVVVCKGYGGSTRFVAQYDESAAVNHLAKSLELPSAANSVRAANNFEALHAALGDVPEPHSTVKDLIATVESWPEQKFVLHFEDRYLSPMLPRFFYFDDYNIMKGKVSLQAINARKTAGALEPSEETFLALLSTAEAELSDLEKSDYEALVRELEGAANGITDDVMQYWSQNKELEVVIAVAQADPNDRIPLNQGSVVHVRIRNSRHRVTVPFDERSRGFVWFFSFFAYFSDIEVDQDRGTIILLDEPGLNLHATAQGDFLRFIEERLAGKKKHQVIYTTHSPFLIDPRHIERVRTVQDVDNEGTKVTSEVFKTDRETLFPLQGALGYDLAQTLFVGPNCLLVEGPSDMLFLQLLSQACGTAGRSTLDDRWTITPVGGADKVSTFVTLLGSSQLNTAVVMDANSKDKARVEGLQMNGYLGKKSLVLISEVTGQPDSDVEDVFAPTFYLELINGVYGTKIRVGDLTAKDGRIINRLQQHFQENGIAGGRLNHYKPAAYFLREQGKFLPKLNEKTLQRASDLFDRINALLP